MSTTQWILNLGLLGWVLLRNLGSKPVTRSNVRGPAARSSPSPPPCS